ncbi:hypothetical protein GCM10018782_56450 [Streptomyces griseoaurantiacus]|nr:hypothetical protein GCM10018782_56450 [Streptomyces griseoaurantiacus]
MPSPTVTSRRAAVLTSTPGIDVRTGEGGLRQGVDLGFQGPALFVDSGERAGQCGHGEVEGGGPRDHPGLLVQRLEGIVDQPLDHVVFPGPAGRLAMASGPA